MTRLAEKHQRLIARLCGLMRAELDVHRELLKVRQMVADAEAELKAIEERQVTEMVKQEER